MVDWRRVPKGTYKLPKETSLAGLTVAGEDFRATLEEIATATTLTANHYLVLVNGNVRITLPKAVLHKERVYTIKNIGSGVVTIDGTGDDKLEWKKDLILGGQGDFVVFVSESTQWYIIGGGYVKMEELLSQVIDKLEESNKTLDNIETHLSLGSGEELNKEETE